MVLVRPGQKFLTSDDAARRIAANGFRSVAVDLGISEGTLRAVMRADGYAFTKKMIWQEPRLPGLEGVVPSETESTSADEHEDPARVQGPVAAGG